MSSSNNSVTAVFSYDGDGNRVKTAIEQGSLTTTTTYIGNYLEWTTDSGGNLDMYYYYYAGGVRVAEYCYDYVNMTSVNYWLLSDQLGSTTVTAYVSGSFASELRYKPWGEQRYTSGTTPTKEQYTGQVHKASLGGVDGLYFYQSRYYDPVLGRFTSPDTIVPNPYNPQDWDRYAYVHNSPIVYNDPTGHAQCSNWQHGCDEETNMTDAELAALHARRGVETASPEVIDATTKPEQKIANAETAITGSAALRDANGTETNDAGNCIYCVIGGTLAIVGLLPLEFVLGVGMIIVAGTPGVEWIDIILFPIEIGALNLSVVGAEYIIQGATKPAQDIKVDVLPIVHIFFPNFLK